MGKSGSTHKGAWLVSVVKVPPEDEKKGKGE